MFSLILARLKARPRLLRAWLEDAKRELEAQGVTAQEPSGTGCEDDEDEDEDEGTPAGAGDKGSGVLSNGAAAYAQLEVRHSWGAAQENLGSDSCVHESLQSETLLHSHASASVLTQHFLQAPGTCCK